MKTIVVPLIGDPKEALYQLGLREKDSFLALEERVQKLLSTNAFLRQGQEIISRARILLRKKEDSEFEQAINSYCDGMKIEPVRFHSFLSLLEAAAHFGHVYPELKGLLPGCTSVFSKTDNEYSHARLLDFPLIGLYNEQQRLYYWQPEGKEAILTISCEGLAPLFFQGIHGSGFSFALHHKPGNSWHKEGQSIFQILYESLFQASTFADVRKELRRKTSMTKWSFLSLEQKGQVFILDIDGPAQNHETYHLDDSSPLIFTNVPLQKEDHLRGNYLRFCEERSRSAREALKGKGHILDLLSDVNHQKLKNWIHPATTLSTVGAYLFNLQKGHIDLKEGTDALTSHDGLLRFDLRTGELSVLKEKSELTTIEKAWKRASKAQSLFDEGKIDEAYHELQMASALMPLLPWKQIFEFYLYVWDFRFITNSRELAMVYKSFKALQVPSQLQDLKNLFIMRLEKKLDLSPTVSVDDVSEEQRSLYQQEKLAARPLFTTWMKLLYPRLDVLDVFSPHEK